MRDKKAPVSERSQTVLLSVLHRVTIDRELAQATSG